MKIVADFDRRSLHSEPKHRPRTGVCLSSGEAFPMKIAYLLSEYPTIGHTYLLREVRELRALGWDIQTISIRRPGSRPSSISSAETAELTSTWNILGSGWMEFSTAHVAT